jgi:hypothetical protein
MYIGVHQSTLKRAMAKASINNLHVILDDELAAKLEDFRAAFYRAEKTEIVKEALHAYIDSVLKAEPERKKRYDAAQKKRLSESDREGG